MGGKSIWELIGDYENLNKLYKNSALDIESRIKRINSYKKELYDMVKEIRNREKLNVKEEVEALMEYEGRSSFLIEAMEGGEETNEIKKKYMEKSSLHLDSIKKEIIERVRLVDYSLYEQLPPFVIKWREEVYGKYEA